MSLRSSWDSQGKRVVFTNGCFDLLHRGHVEYLQQARMLGDLLVVGVNSDQSVRRLKGPGRPLMPEEDRSHILAALEAVDYVCIFEEDTPLKLIEALLPDLLVKGSDYRLQEVVGREVVEKHGGRVATIPVVPNRSTSGIILQIGKLIQQGILK